MTQVSGLASWDPVAAGVNPPGTNAWMLVQALLPAGVTQPVRPGGTLEIVVLRGLRLALPLVLNSRVWVTTSPTNYAVSALAAPAWSFWPTATSPSVLVAAAPSAGAAASAGAAQYSFLGLTWGRNPARFLPAKGVYDGQDDDLKACYVAADSPADAGAPACADAATLADIVAKGALGVDGLLVSGPTVMSSLVHDVAATAAQTTGTASQMAAREMGGLAFGVYGQEDTSYGGGPAGLPVAAGPYNAALAQNYFAAVAAANSVNFIVPPNTPNPALVIVAAGSNPPPSYYPYGYSGYLFDNI
jgi:hypothetical protein